MVPLAEEEGGVEEALSVIIDRRRAGSACSLPSILPSLVRYEQTIPDVKLHPPLTAYARTLPVFMAMLGVGSRGKELLWGENIPNYFRVIRAAKEWHCLFSFPLMWHEHAYTLRRNAGAARKMLSQICIFARSAVLIALHTITKRKVAELGTWNSNGSLEQREI